MSGFKSYERRKKWTEKKGTGYFLIKKLPVPFFYKEFPLFLHLPATGNNQVRSGDEIRFIRC